MYHDISTDLALIPTGHRPYVLHPALFEHQAEIISNSGLEALTISELCSKRRMSRTLSITFDDGHVSNYKYALPILGAFDLRATFFVTAGRIGVGDTMTWGEIRELHRQGMEIGSHTLTHRPPSTLSDDELFFELSESRRILEEGLGAAVTSISSPTGFFNPRMSRIAKEVGYRGLCIGRVGLFSDTEELFSLNRVAVKNSLSDKQFERLVQFDPLELRLMRTKQWLREVARKSLGVEPYLRLRRTLLGASH
jgi:peptidoglycan/xylan/chitin deacetylase (PgdA/CDA1 family)